MGAKIWDLVGDPTGLEAQLLQLDSAAAASYYRFLSSDPCESVVLRDLLFRDGLADCSPPACQLAVYDGTLAGMYCASTGKSLRQRRLRGAVRLVRGGVAVPPAVIERARMAATSLAHLENDDWYLSRIAVAPEYRGTGLGRELLRRFIAAAAGVQARRCVLEVDTDNDAAIRLYRSAGFLVTGQAGVQHPDTGCTLSYLHMSLDTVHGDV